MLFCFGKVAPATKGVLLNLANTRGFSYGHTYSRLEEVKKIRDVDVLFLGSSRAYRSFDPRIFEKNGLKTFNLGTSSQTPLQTNVLLNRYLENLNPKLVIYVVYIETFVIDGVESSIDIISNDKNDLYSLKMALTNNNIKVYNTLIYSIIDCALTNKKIKEPKTKGKDTYISGGYIESELAYYQCEVYPKSKWIINPTQLNEFEKAIQLFKEKHINYLIVNVPVTSSLYNSYNNAEFDSIMSNYGRYYNFNGMVALDDSLHFFDASHLNQKGVEIFNRKMLEIITLTGDSACVELKARL
jgi:hypothetical protein